MLKVYDQANDYEYARGENMEQLIADWNAKAAKNLSWLLEYGEEQAYEEMTEEIYREENLRNVMDEINGIEVNDLQIVEA